MRPLLGTAALAFALGLAAAPAAFAQAAVFAPATADDGGHAPMLAIKQIRPAKPRRLKVTSGAFKDGGDIPFRNTQFRDNAFPGLSWSKGPKGTKSYLAVMQAVLTDGENVKLGTSVHFVLFNIPADVTQIDEGLKTPPPGAAFGSNTHGFKDVYAGPHTHTKDKHAYHLQVFALDRTMPADTKAELNALEAAAKGHVLASGEIVGWAGVDPESPEAKQR